MPREARMRWPWDRDCTMGGQHVFQPRYSTRPALVSILDAAKRNGVELHKLNGEWPAESVYVCDVCIDCGKIVKP